MNEWKNRPGSSGHINLLVSQRGLCYSIWLSPFPGSQTLPRIPDHPTLGADWCVPHEVSSNPQCPLFLLPPSHCPLAEQAVQGWEKEEKKKISMNEETSTSVGNQNQKPPNSLREQSISLQGLGIPDLHCCFFPYKIKCGSSRDIKLSQKSKLLFTLVLSNGDSGKNIFKTLGNQTQKASLVILLNF